MRATRSFRGSWAGIAAGGSIFAFCFRLPELSQNEPELGDAQVSAQNPARTWGAFRRHLGG
jgi:hypothetical protein